MNKLEQEKNKQRGIIAFNKTLEAMIKELNDEYIRGSYGEISHDVAIKVREHLIRACNEVNTFQLRHDLKDCDDDSGDGEDL